MGKRMVCGRCHHSLPAHYKICPFDGEVLVPDAVSELKTGRVLDGKYRLEEELGQGSMGTVYRATHVHLHTTHAIKVLRFPEWAKDDIVKQLVKRFGREARAIRRLNSEYIVKVSDLGQTRGGIHYIAMDYVDGPTLRAEIRNGWPIGVPRAVAILSQIAEALAEIHRRGMIHRDLKSENIKLDRVHDRKVKLLDFGLVKHLDDPDLTQLTRSGDLLGTPKYMSPEQAQGIPADVRSDIYSFGIVAYETLVGAVPFTGSEREILQQQIHETPTAPSVHGVVLPATLEAMMLKCLEKCRDRRFQSADEVVAILHNVLSELRDIHSPFESDWSCTAEDSDRCGSDAIPEPSDAGMAIANQPPNQSVSDASAPFNGSVTVVPQDGGTPARDQSCDIDEQTVAQSIDAVELSSGTSQSSIVADPREHDRRSPYSADLWIGQAPVVSSRWQVTGDQTVPALVIESVITHTPRRPRSSRIRAQVAAAVMACVGVIVSAVWTTTTLRDPVRSDVRPPLVHAEPPTERVHQSYNDASPSAVEQRALAKSAMVAVNRPNESKSHRPVRDSQADNQEVAASADVSRDVPTRATNTWPSNNAVSERRPDNYGANAVRTSAMPTEPTAATTFVSMGGAISRRSMADLLADKKSTPIDKSMRSTIDQTFGNHPDVVWASNAPTVDQLRTFPDPLNRKAGPEQIGVPLISLGVRFKKRWPFLTPRMGN